MHPCDSLIFQSHFRYPPKSDHQTKKKTRSVPPPTSNNCNHGQPGHHHSSGLMSRRNGVCHPSEATENGFLPTPTPFSLRTLVSSRHLISTPPPPLLRRGWGRRKKSPKLIGEAGQII
ncbi:hypothetical protein CEXT_172051 [Caerostris extrusa]|uniref:Uncharacterized protein n=1 Tax=Caerostris extrusa TaxID=172846 RepID=A0AAV4YDI7_CAEEX|nr:hypothetical protein CEXT_172051 [Caerostris extrusa]